MRCVVWPGPPLPIVKSKPFARIRPIGVTTAAVPQANASRSRPLSASARHLSVDLCIRLFARSGQPHIARERQDQDRA